jgi:hypothetical protein
VLCCATCVLVADVDVVHVLWSPSSHPVCCGGGCNAWGLLLQSSCAWCGAAIAVFACAAWGHHRSLRAMCVVVMGVVHWVIVMVFARVVWGHHCHQCAMCIVVLVFMPCVLWSQV